MGAFLEDGKCELDLEVWKHPERMAHTDYEVIMQASADNDKETDGKVQIVIYGEQAKTGKIELNDGGSENSAMDSYEFKAPDVGKVPVTLFTNSVRKKLPYLHFSKELK